MLSPQRNKDQEPDWTGQVMEQMLIDLWRQDRHGAHGVRQLQLAGGQVDILPSTCGQGRIGLVRYHDYVALAHSPTISLLLAADQVASELQNQSEPQLVLVPEPLGQALTQRWNQLAGRQAVSVVTDQYFFRRGSCKPVDETLPLQRASARTASEVAERMAVCWLEQNGEWKKPEWFTQLLQHSQALLWCEGHRIDAFQVFTDLGHGQLLLGQACGAPDKTDALFNAVASLKHLHPQSLLSVCVEEFNTKLHSKLKAKGFVPKDGLRFNTLLLS